MHPTSPRSAGELRLRHISNRWQLSFQPTTRRYAALFGDSFSYVGRKERSRQDWSRFPVAGISSVDIVRYLGWLSSTGRVPGARLCTEVEWERAARGADDRLYPHGDDLAAADANFDLTYDRTDGAYGPDEIGSHPASRSPFGVDDLAGNAYELVVSSMKTDRAGDSWRRLLLRIDQRPGHEPRTRAGVVQRRHDGHSRLRRRRGAPVNDRAAQPLRLRPNSAPRRLVGSSGVGAGAAPVSAASTSAAL